MSRMNQHAELYAELATIPEITNAFMTESGISVLCQERDIDGNQLRNYAIQLAAGSGFEFRPCGFPTDLGNVAGYMPSPSGRLLAVIRTVEAKSREHAQIPSRKEREGEDGKYKIEIWNAMHMVTCTPLEGKHGQIYNDGWFGGIAWTATEDAFVYVAEAVLPPAGTFWSQKENEAALRGAKFEFAEDWGEAYVGRSRPTLFQYTLADRTVREVPGVPADVAAGQPVLTPDRVLLFVGWATVPYRLGVKYCYNRAAGGAGRPGRRPPVAQIVSEPGVDWAVRSPRVLPDGRVAYLSVGAVRSHNATAALRVCSLGGGGGGGAWSTAVTVCADGDAAAVAIRTVAQWIEAGAATPVLEVALPGLHTDTLPRRCVTADGQTVVLATQVGLYQVVVAVSTAAGSGPARARVYALPPGLGQAVVLDVQHETALAMACSPTRPHGLWLLNLTTGAWTAVSTPVPTARAQSALQPLQWRPLRAEGRGVACEGVLVLPAGADVADGAAVPLVVMPHGGPHSSFVAQWFVSVVFLVATGRAVLMANYTGSTGYDEPGLQSLCGRIGAADVQDVMALADAAGRLCGGPMAVIGGSHGGFLSGHLIGQFPDRFCAAVLRNPVLNLTSMKSATDIPDWVDCEVTAAAYDPVPSRETVTRMFDMSPIAHVSRVRCPVLLMIGSKDRRVPPFQSVEYHRALVSRGVPARMLVYPDCGHAIATPGSEADAWVNVALWLDRYQVASAP